MEGKYIGDEEVAGSRPSTSLDQLAEGLHSYGASILARSPPASGQCDRARAVRQFRGG
jgi:hypothetical protein